MNKRTAFSVLASALTIVVTNGVIYATFYGHFLQDYSGLPPDLFAKIQKPVEETEILPTILSMLLAGGLITLFTHLMKARTFVAGAKAGFLLCLLMVGSVNMGLLATTHYYSHISAVVDVLVAALTFAAAGGVAALVLRRGEPPAAETEKH